MVIVWISAILLPCHLPIHGPIVGQTVPKLQLHSDEEMDPRCRATLPVRPRGVLFGDAASPEWIRRELLERNSNRGSCIHWVISDPRLEAYERMRLVPCEEPRQRLPWLPQPTTTNRFSEGRCCG